MSRQRAKQEASRVISQTFAEAQGLASAVGERPAAAAQEIPLEIVVPNRYNPRESYSAEGLQELATSMEEHGFLGALDGRRLPDGRVEAAYGASRILAARMAGLATIPMYIHDEGEWDDVKMLEIALVENLLREDLNVVETADALARYQQMLTEKARRLEERGLPVDRAELSQRGMARRLGKHKTWVDDHLALSRAPEDVREMVKARPDTLRAARHIARVPDLAKRQELEHLTLAQALPTRDLQIVVQQLIEGITPAETPTVATAAAPPVTEEEAVAAEASTTAPPVGARAPTRAEAKAERSAGSRLLTRAVFLLNQFEAAAMPEGEVEEALVWLQQIDQRAWTLKQRLEARLMVPPAGPATEQPKAQS